jgi:PAP2 superfamily protein
MKSLNILARAAAAALSLLSAVPLSADEVLRWNRVATDVAARARTDPFTESRALAITQLAVHDAVNSVDRQYDTYGPVIPAAKGASAEAAVAAAAYATLVELFPAARDVLDAQLREALSAIPAGHAASAGVDVGRQAAARTLAARRDDGANRSLPFRPGSEPGAYRPTPPDFTPAIMTQWGTVAPFALRSAGQFRPSPPPAAGTAQAQADVDEVRKMGARAGSLRNDEQSEIARFWYENVAQGWNRIARSVAADRHLDLWANARLFALLNVAIADGFIAAFEAKYHYAYWRPATAIREAGDGAWLSYLDTPPVPDHPSAHAVTGAAAAAVLARCFESDFVSFTATSGDPYPGLVRHFWSFSEAARENGASRVLAGIHFPTAVRAGLEQGDEVGAWLVDNALRPIASTPRRASAPR